MSDKVTYYFYVLIDPRDNKIKYVGRTVNIKTRLTQHISEAKKNNHNKRERWIVFLNKISLKPIFKVIYKEYCNIESAISTERMLVKKLSKRFDLKNSPDNYLGAVLTGKPVHQYSIHDGSFIKTYANSNQAFILTGIKDSNICRCCKSHKQRTAGGYFWSNDKFERYPLKYNKDWRHLKGKPVIMMNLNNVELKLFKTARIAEKETGTPYRQISACCKGKCEISNGYKWKFDTNI